MAQFYILLRKHREASGLSLQELVDQVNTLGSTDTPRTITTTATLSRWEAGKSVPQKNDRTRKVLLHCSKILDLSAQETNALLEAANKPLLSEQEWKMFFSPTLAYTHFIEELFEHFDHSCPAPILLLSPFDLSPILNLLFSHASSRYIDSQRCHLSLPHFTEDAGTYFSELALAFNLAVPVHNGTELEFELRKMLSNCKRYFLLISRFEKTSKERGQELGGILRSLHEQFSGHLHIVLCGGKKLEELKLLPNKHSLLNYAKVYSWPELTVEDVCLKYNSQDQSRLLNTETIEKLLVISGKHPMLLEICLQWYFNSPELLPKLTEKLSMNDKLHELFVPFIDSDQNKRHISIWSKYPKIGSCTVYRSTSLIREMYWAGLLIKQENGQKDGIEDGIYWRCEAIQLAGQFMISNS